VLSVVDGKRDSANLAGTSRSANAAAGKQPSRKAESKASGSQKVRSSCRETCGTSSCADRNGHARPYP
jgi:hypothetical protein